MAVMLGLALVAAACTGGSESDSADTGTEAAGSAAGSEGTDGEARRGGTAVLAMVQEPGGMNQLFHDQSGAFLGGEAGWVVEPLFVALPDGTYEPRLAAEVPTVDNGGLSEDGRTVTYRLREEATWSDGEPFTADDIVFTFDVFDDPDSTALVPTDYQLVESVTAVDDHTVEVQMTEPNPAYLALWKQVLPEHEFDSTAVTAEHPQARLPLGTGPFVFTGFEAGNQITLERNPDYWRDPNLPYLDGITLKITPDKQVATTSFLDGQYDSVFFFVTADLPDLDAAAEAGAPITVATQDTNSWVEWLFLNHSDSGDPDVPHPVLGDPAIREALAAGIDRQAVIDQVLGGFGTLAGSPIYAGTHAVDIPPTDYDPDHAKQVLDEAGWEPGPNRVRSKDGVTASLSFTTIAGDQSRQLYQQIMQQNLAEVGIELNIENEPSNIIFGGFSEGGLLATGDYDIVMSRDGYYVDPVSWLAEFTCDSIPNSEHPGRSTYAHYCNEDFDALVQEAASTLDQEQRQDLYEQAANLFHEEHIAVPVYSSTWGWAWNDRLQGVSTDYWSGMWLSVAEWYLAE